MCVHLCVCVCVCVYTYILRRYITYMIDIYDILQYICYK